MAVTEIGNQRLKTLKSKELGLGFEDFGLFQVTRRLPCTILHGSNSSVCFNSRDLRNNVVGVKQGDESRNDTKHHERGFGFQFFLGVQSHLARRLLPLRRVIFCLQVQSREWPEEVVSTYIISVSSSTSF
ncbi:hypothetical protein ACFX2I_037797 [Malus domestica]